MKPVHRIFALAGLILLMTGCASSNNAIATLNRAQAVGSPYTKYLTAEYRKLANSLQTSAYYGSADALHFARKGLATADGVIVMPEAITDWNLGDGDIAEMSRSRADLVAALAGSRDLMPEKAAIAQTRFDCWVAQRSNGSCKGQFIAALKDLNDAMGTGVPAVPVAAAPAAVTEEFPAPVGDAPKGAVTPVQQAAYLVFFDWDKSNLSGSAKDVLATAAKEIRTHKDMKQIVVVGHTDTSGSEKYNDGLSMRRAKAVKSALVAHGFPAKKIRIEGRGEKELLVKTADGVREAENRRAQITLE